MGFHLTSLPPFTFTHVHKNTINRTRHFRQGYSRADVLFLYLSPSHFLRHSLVFSPHDIYAGFLFGTLERESRSLTISLSLTQREKEKSSCIFGKGWSTPNSKQQTNLSGLIQKLNKLLRRVKEHSPPPTSKNTENKRRCLSYTFASSVLISSHGRFTESFQSTGGHKESLGPPSSQSTGPPWAVLAPQDRKSGPVLLKKKGSHLPRANGTILVLNWH